MTDPYKRYFRLLGIEDLPSGLEGLRTLVRRHLAIVPFENVSKLLLCDRAPSGHITSLPEFLDGIEFSDLGGTCYTNNPFLTDLLRALGYDAELLGADMSRPNVHTCIRARIGSVAYHIDVGFGAPFREPLRLDRLPVKIEEGTNRYLLETDPGSSGLRLRMLSGEDPGPAYVVHAPARPREFFNRVVLDSFAPASTFMNCLRISRVFEAHSLDLIDRTLYRHEAGKTAIAHLESLKELQAAVKDQFGMPRCPIEHAVAILERLTGKPFFGAG